METRRRWFRVQVICWLFEIILLSNFSTYRTPEEQEWTATELKNSLRSIEWDVEDLEDTIQVFIHVK